MLSAEETLAKEPLVKKNGLKGGGYYVEYRTDDARLTIEVMKEAVKFGAEAVNYAKVSEFIYDNGKVPALSLKTSSRKKRTASTRKKLSMPRGRGSTVCGKKTIQKKANTFSIQKACILFLINRSFL